MKAHRSSLPAHATSVELEVPFFDCDPLAVVWHGRYFQYFELARTALLRSLQLDVPDLREAQVKVFITEARCRYVFPLTLGDQFRVTAWFSEREPLLKVSYDLHNLTKGRRAARASTRLALTDVAGNLLSEVPLAIAARLPAIAAPRSREAQHD